jgi:hypothetical protein
MKSVAMALVSWTVLTVWTWLTLPFSWLVPISFGITVGILYAIGTASAARGWSLFTVLAALNGGIGVINIHVENLVFKIQSPAEVLRGVVSGLLVAVGVAAALAWGRTRDVPPPRASEGLGLARGVWWKIPVLGAIFVVLFLTAGALALPFVRSFYRTSGLITMPSLGVVVLTEFVRGVIYVGALLPFLCRMGGRRTQAAVLAGFALPILGGIAALLMPIDDILPLEVRQVHMVEIFGSTFVFGVLIAFLLVRPVSTLRPTSVHVSG